MYAIDVQTHLCNQQVGGSSPSTSSNPFSKQQTEYGGIPEWPKGADCKSVVSDFGGSNPPSPTKAEPDEPDVFAWLFCFLNDLYDRWHIHSCVFSCARIEKEAPAHLHDGQVLLLHFFVTYFVIIIRIASNRHNIRYIITKGA